MSPIRIAFFAAVVTAAFAVAAPAQARSTVTQISSDPFTPNSMPTAAHATEVEPDTFAFGSTVVATFQTGRVFNGGSSDIGWATSLNDGVTWTHGFLPATTPASTPTGPFFSVSDPSVAFDVRHGVWLISWLGAHFSGGGVVDVMTSRSTDGGLSWSNPVVIAANGVFYDKNWSVCDNTATSRFYGNCYTEFDNASSRDLEQMSTSTDGGLTWGPPLATADTIHGLGGPPVVQPNGRVVVPFEGLNHGQGIRAFTSDDGGLSWNRSVRISTVASHDVPGLRTSPLPSAEINAAGVVYVVWQDNRFEAGGKANDIVLSSSADGTTWSPLSRIPIDAVGSNIDHFIPGLGVDRATFGASTALALTYYFQKPAGCVGLSCTIQVGFVSSLNNGQTWSSPQTLSDPMQLGWIAPTSQGAMVGDYISTSFVAPGQAVGVFAIGFPMNGSLFNEPMFAGQETVGGGSAGAGSVAVLFSGVNSNLAAPATTF